MIATVTLNPAVDKIFIAPDFALNKLNRAKKAISIPGGKGINIACTAQILGAEALATGFVGGMPGNFIERSLRELGVTTNFVHIDKDTRTNYVILDEKKARLTQLNEKGPEIEPEEIEQLQFNFERALAHAELVVIAGSFPPGLPPEVCANLVEEAKKGGVKTILNTKEKNIHTVDRCIRVRPFLIKPDVRETDKLEGIKINSTSNRIKAGKALLERGAEIVIIGPDPIDQTVVTKDKAWEVTTEKIEITNRVGAGDALLAGLAYTLAQDSDITEAMRLGTAAAIATAKTIINRPASREEVETYLPKVTVREVEQK